MPSQRDVFSMSSAEKKADEIHETIQEPSSHFANEHRGSSQHVFELDGKRDRTSFEFEEIWSRMRSSLFHPTFTQVRKELHFLASSSYQTFSLTAIFEFFPWDRCPTSAIPLRITLQMTSLE